jgi:exodeoxyribonuclease-5
LSREVRNGKNIKHGTYGDSVIKMRNDEVTDDIFLDADQVIVGTNKTRKDFNSWFRDALGRTQNGVMPVEDDKLICLRNNWADGLVNGMMLTATSRAQATKNRQKFKLSFTAQESADSTLTFKDKWCNASEILGAKLDIPYWEQKKLVSLDYGYAITCHKSQGSQYNDVVFVDEGFGRWLDDNTYYRHLYTAITRAAEHLIILE